VEAPVDAGKGRGAQCPVSHGPMTPLLHCLLPHCPMSQKRAGARELPLPPFAPPALASPSRPLPRELPLPPQADFVAPPTLSLEPGKTSMSSYFLKAYGRVTQRLLDTVP
jgi:hypothetical protein